MPKFKKVFVFFVASVQFSALLAQVQGPAGRREGAVPQLPDGAGRDFVQKVCGSICHGPEMLMNSGRTRDQWTAVVNTMVTRGAKVTEPELLQILQYLIMNLGPNIAPMAGRGPGTLGAGAADSHVVDSTGAERGKVIYAAECSSCHGVRARGGNEALPMNQRGPDLIRSLTVLRDRYASEIGPFLSRGHPMRSGRSSTALTEDQLTDLAHFLHQRVYYTLRSSPELEVQNVLTGDPKAGAVFYDGPGNCGTCHSVTGDLANIGSRYDPVTIQMKVLFPRTVAFGRPQVAGLPTEKPVTVTVMLPSDTRVEGALDKLDDFYVSLWDGTGEYRSFKITPQVKVVKDDPVEAHVKLLDKYTDKDIHDVVAYLESLK